MGLREELIETLEAIFSAREKYPEVMSIRANGCEVVFSRQPTPAEPGKDEIADMVKAFGPPVGEKPPETIKEGRYRGLAAEDVFAAAVPPSDS